SRKTISEVDSAMLRALRATTASSPRAVMMNPTPTSGRNVTSERSGQWLMQPPGLRPVGRSRTGGGASFETAASRPPQDEDKPLIPHTDIPHPEERPAGARLEGRTALRQPGGQNTASGAHRGNRYQVTSATTPISMAKA